MKLSTPRYTFCLLLQCLFIFLDLTFNCISMFPRSRDGLLVLFIFQDLFLVFSVTTMLMMFFSTYLFQAGLVEVLWRRVRAGAAAAAAYGAACLAVHAVTLLHAGASAPASNSTLLAVLFTVQRCLSPWYYFMCKRTALRVSDPRYYEDLDWIHAQLQNR